MENNNEKKAMLHDALVLFVITLISGLLLGFIYQITKGSIEEQNRKKAEKACATVFAQATSFDEIEAVIGEESLKELEKNKITVGKVYNAMDAEGNCIGHVIETISSAGFNGNIAIYSGITKEGKLCGISILEISETPGLGMRAEEVLVPQFSDKEVSVFTYTKTGSTRDDEIDAISGATITTKAVIGAVNGALLVEKNDLAE